ncbi:DUF1330 domain-containing protein [Pontibacter rugosus]|uniref:DUF1330 domain-containing protein n=1 Tax=Pontibacter rugosus TaxID=1745966 RepID=A0ABW3SR95_9BACT
MPAYIIAEIDVTDPETYTAYTQLTPATLAAYGGKFIVRGGQHETLEGDWQPNRMVVLEFESLARAKEWWNSPEYAGPKSIRQKASNTNMIVIEGYSA